jgi:hypothetical protein
MKDLSEITKKETIEIGNRAFRKHTLSGRKEMYHSNKWKLHLFLDKKGRTEKIAIVDEIEPLMHIDNLWSKSPNERHSHDGWRPYPQYNWIEISKDLVISHHSVTNLDLLLSPESQYFIFWWLEQNGFMGEKAIPL